MRRESTLTLLMTVGLIAPMAIAQDYGDRGSDSAIKDNSEAGVRVVGFAGGAWRTINSDGYVSIPISSVSDPEFHAIGEIDVETSGETDVVEVAWWELALPNEHYVQFVYRTQNEMQFVPFGSKEGGSLIQAYTYEMGGNGNGIDFRAWVTSVQWDELTISYSYDGGQTVFSDPTIYDPIGGGNWNGTDDEHFGLAFPGDGVNWIEATYKVTVVPAPASAALLVGPGALLLRRRR